MTTILLDTHAVQWWSAEPDRLSSPARAAIDQADELAVSAMTWFELAWLATRGRIAVSSTVSGWLRTLSARFSTFPITAELAAVAAALPAAIPSDPADRLIYATAVQHKLRLVTKDRALRAHGPAVTIW